MHLLGGGGRCLGVEKYSFPRVLVVHLNSILEKAIYINIYVHFFKSTLTVLEYTYNRIPKKSVIRLNLYLYTTHELMLGSDDDLHGHSIVSFFFFLP